MKIARYLTLVVIMGLCLPFIASGAYRCTDTTQKNYTMELGIMVQKDIRRCREGAVVSDYDKYMFKLPDNSPFRSVQVQVDKERSRFLDCKTGLKKVVVSKGSWSIPIQIEASKVGKRMCNYNVEFLVRIYGKDCKNRIPEGYDFITNEKSHCLIRRISCEKRRCPDTKMGVWDKATKRCICVPKPASSGRP
ncbi:hypothetical protein H8E77_03885 [bacterium]|nr:hypothetical protein [bacterium]